MQILSAYSDVNTQNFNAFLKPIAPSTAALSILLTGSTSLPLVIGYLGAMQKRLLILGLLWVCVNAWGSSTYKIGVLAFRGSEQALTRWQPTIDYLNKASTEQSFELVPLSLEAVKTRLQEQSIDFLLTNTGQFVSLESQHRLTALASLKNKSRDRYLSRFGAVIFSRKDSLEIESLQDLKGKRFAAVAPQAFGGFQMAWRELLEQGIDPEKDLGELRFLGFPQDAIVQAVLDGRVEAGTVRTGLLEDLAEQGKLNLADIRLLNPQEHSGFPYWVSTRLYPEWPLAALPHVELSLRDRVKTLLLEMPAEHENNQHSRHGGWSNEFDYRSVSELFKILGLLPQQNARNFNLIALAFSLALIMLFLMGYLLIVKQNRGQNHNFLQASAILVLLIISLLYIAQLLIKDFEHQQKILAHEIGQKMVADIEQHVALRTALTQQSADIFAPELSAKQPQMDALLYNRIASRIGFLANDLEMLAIADTDQSAVLMDPAHPLGPDCKHSVNEFLHLSTGDYFKNIVVHGLEGRYHFDTMVRLQDNPERIFFSSYNLNQINQHLKLATQLGFEAVVVQRNNPTQIEFSSENIRSSALFGAQIDSAQLNQSLFEAAIEGTNWRLEIFPRASLWNQYQRHLFIAFVVISSFTLIIFLLGLHRLRHERRQKLDLLAHANSDPLTGLPNRRNLEQFAAQVLRQAQRDQSQFALMYLDLDGFKDVNDRLGHDIGDQLLIKIGEQFQTLVRSNERIARIGGDEFCLLIPVFKHFQEVEKTAQRFIAHLHEKDPLDDELARVGLSIGIACYPKDGKDFNELLSHADCALYRVKRNGKGHFQRYDPSCKKHGQAAAHL